jgi:NAD(P)H-hydrate epimerase
MNIYKSIDNISVRSVNKKQIKEIDRIAIEVTGPNLFQMMENAGRNLAELTLKALNGNKDGQEIIILAGTGGNGGGGICAARHLANRGYNVGVCLTNLNKLREVPAYQLKILQSTNAEIISIDELKTKNPDIIIDAIIGYSLIGEPKDEALQLIKWAESRLSVKISLDIPSGIDADSGSINENYIKPDLTLTLALPKIGLKTELTGELFLSDVGIPKKVFSRLGIDYISPFNKDYIVKLKQ